MLAGAQRAWLDPVISDPGLLLSRIHPIPLHRPPPPKGVGFITHSADRTHFRSIAAPSSTTTERWSPSSTSSHVVSSSLHGIIFCHSVGHTALRTRAPQCASTPTLRMYLVMHGCLIQRLCGTLKQQSCPTSPASANQRVSDSIRMLNLYVLDI